MIVLELQEKLDQTKLRLVDKEFYRLIVLELELEVAQTKLALVETKFNSLIVYGV